MQNTFRLPWQTLCDLNAYYATHHLGVSNEYVASTGFVDIGFSKHINNKWNISLTCSDVFKTTRRNNHSSYHGFELWNWFRGETRQVKLNITYKFGKQKKNSHNSDFNEINQL